MENEIINPFAAAGGFGIILSLGWFSLLIACRFWSWVWSWIDDSDTPKYGVITLKVMKILGFEKSDRWSAYEFTDSAGNDSDGAIAIYLPAFILLVSPFLIVLGVTLYPVTLSAFGLYLTARLARFARRHKKLFDEHVKDKSAHK